MSDKKKSKSAAPKTKRVTKRVPRTKAADAPGKKSANKTTKASAKSTPAKVKTRKAGAGTVAAPAAKRVSKTRTAAGRTEKSTAKKTMRKTGAEDGAAHRIEERVVDAIGDVNSHEAATTPGDLELLARTETEESQAEADSVDTGADVPGLPPHQATLGLAGVAGLETGAANLDDDVQASAAAQPAKHERLQKILSQAGIASRRHAEEMIAAGRVMVNGQVVTTLGSKADPARDHIRVDGKLLHGAARHRYFVLNKPKGYVTTVSDPEGRPTVMEFFAKMGERVYPVGRLDYQSEGLLLMTNDGELANLLTKAGSGVEKTYLVKVAGRPSEEDLERLRGGVAIEREEAGSERVRTAPAWIRPVREGDNPWYEVVLIEGRNRELRKMFSAVGHFVEKIRRVGYGPLVLDVEPGKQRELTPEEVNALRLTAEGKLKPKRLRLDRIPPVESGRAPEKRAERRAAREDRPRGQRDERPGKTEWKSRRPEFRERQSAEIRGGEFRGGAKRGSDKRGKERFGARPRFDRPSFSGREHGEQSNSRYERPAFGGRPRHERAEPRFQAEPRFDATKRRSFHAPGARPFFKRDVGSEKRFEKSSAGNFGASPGKAWTQGSRTGAGGTGGRKQFAPAGRFERRGGSKAGGFSKPGGFSKGRGFSKAGGKRPDFRGRFGGDRRGGSRPPGKPGGGTKRG